MGSRASIILIGTLAAGLARAATFTVTTTDDTGAGSLRQAILDANGTVGADDIAFDVPGGGVHTIQPASPLPDVTEQVTIDGTTQPGYAGTPLVELDGSLAGTAAFGLRLSSHMGSTVRGLAVNRFKKDAGGTGGAGIALSQGGSHTIVANVLGTDPAGTTDLGNERWGVAIIASSGNQIGGTSPSGRNLLSGNNDAGVLIQGGSDNVVEGNYIGTNADGTSAIEGSNGVFILASGTTADNRIGGTSAGAGNVILGLSAGVTIGNVGTTGTIVEGNLIGTNAAGTATLGFMSVGVNVNGAPGCRIGGATAAAGNVIAGASSAGITIANANANGTVVQNNVIGTDASGTIPLPNGTGVSVRFSASGSPQGATIGGPGAGNRIMHNTAEGIAVVSGLSGNVGMVTMPRRIRLQENLLAHNGGLGIDLEDDGVTPNDADDLDDGANGLQNAPVLTLVSAGAGTTTIEGTLDAAPSATFTIEVFTSTSADPSATGEGESFLAAFEVMTDADGDASFSEVLPQELANDTVVSATATDSDGNTSEFSNDLVVGGPPPTSTTSTTSTSTTTATSSTSTSSTTTSTTSTTTASTAVTSSTSTTSTTAPPTTTTTATTSTSTTSTTLPTMGEPLAGAKLLLADNSAKPAKRRLLAISADRAALALGGPDAAAALAATGGSLRVSAIGGDEFDTTYPLPAAGWRPLRGKKPEKGLRYAAANGPITSIVIKARRRLVVKGRGAGLGHSLAVEPVAVELELEVGDRRFCLVFAGQGRFVGGKRLLRKRAPAAACTAAASSTGALAASPDRAGG